MNMRQRPGQSRVAETWINKAEKSDAPRPSAMLRKEAADAVKSAMEDESAAWLKRSAAQQKQAEASKEGAQAAPKKKSVVRLDGVVAKPPNLILLLYSVGRQQAACGARL